MERVCYMVTATLSGEALAREYVDWLRGGHFERVVRAGAESGTILWLDKVEPGSPEVRVTAQYVFASREALDRYLKDHAPALRAEGAKRFGTGPGVKFERSVGTVVQTWRP